MCDANVKTEVKQFDKTTLRKTETEEKSKLPTQTEIEQEKKINEQERKWTIAS
uniref:Thymosin beta n=1 Tax=Hippocampus comes TaxID=109280 RepID=A0A3Q3D3T9_HIPCM